MPPRPPTRMSGVQIRAWGDGGLDNSEAPNNGYAGDKGGSDGGMENKKIKQYGRHEGGSHANSKTGAKRSTEKLGGV